VAGEQLGLALVVRRRLSLGFAALALSLALAFVGLGYATLSEGSVESGGSALQPLLA
jgi:hypothetical protein